MSTLDINLILKEILPRLPIKTITRFKCVSKSFRSKIASPYFLKLYSHYQFLSIGANDLLVIPHPERTLCYNLNSVSPYNVISMFLWYCGGSIEVVGSCNGLLCLYGRNNNTYLCVLNPTTHFFREISIGPHGEHYIFGFAYDHVNFDYKIVAIDDGIRSTSVYSMNTNSWMVVRPVKSDETVIGRFDGALINGHLLHWFLWSPTTGGSIGCFDVCTMKWVDDVFLPLFCHYDNHENDFLGFGVFDDQLFTSFQNHVDSCFDVWVMKEYGVQDSWFKLFSIPVSNDLQGGVVPVVMCPRGSNEILIRQCDTSRLLWYNNKNGVLRDSKFNGASSDFTDFPVYTCRRSLVDIPLGKRFWNVYLGRS